MAASNKNTTTAKNEDTQTVVAEDNPRDGDVVVLGNSTLKRATAGETEKALADFHAGKLKAGWRIRFRTKGGETIPVVYKPA